MPSQRGWQTPRFRLDSSRTGQAVQVAETSGRAVVELLAQLIRNGCVSGGWLSTGEESRNAADLRAVLEGPGLDVEWFEPVPGRPSLVVRISGAEPTSPSLCLLGHTDVVAAGTES